MFQLCSFLLVLFASYSLAEPPEPLVFHWKQATIATKKKHKTHLKLVMRSSQEYPVSFTEGGLIICCYACAKKAGTLKIRLNESSTGKDPEPIKETDSSQLFEWPIKPGTILRKTSVEYNITRLSVSCSASTTVAKTEQQLIPADHEINLETEDLDWLEELLIYIVNISGDVPNKQVGAIAHIIHTSGARRHCELPALADRLFRPKFLSILIEPKDLFPAKVMTADFATQIIQWENELADRRLKSIHQANTEHKHQSESKIDPASLDTSLPAPHTASDEQNGHRYYLTGKAYPDITDEAKDQIERNRGKPSKVDSWGTFTCCSDDINKKDMERSVLEHLAGCSDPKYNESICKLTYPTLILDTDPRPDLRGQLGLFARKNLPAHQILGVYGGILCHYTEQSLFEKILGIQTREYFHSTGPGQGNRKKLTISPYQFGNLLSLCNTDRVEECSHDPDHPRNINTLNARLTGISYIVFITGQPVPKDQELLIDYGSCKQKALRTLIQSSESIPDCTQTVKRAHFDPELESESKAKRPKRLLKIKKPPTKTKRKYHRK